MSQTIELPAGPTIWKAVYSLSGQAVGYLVTEHGNINAPLAMVVHHEVGTMGDLREELLALATELANNPFLADCRPCIDLRHYARAESRRATPRWIYSLVCVPVDNDGKDIGGFAPMVPTPFCYRLKQIMNGEDRAKGGAA